MLQMYAFPLLTFMVICFFSFLLGYYMKPRRYGLTLALILMLPFTMIATAIAMRSLIEAGYDYVWFAPLILILGEGGAAFFFFWGQYTGYPPKLP